MSYNQLMSRSSYFINYSKNSTQIFDHCELKCRQFLNFVNDNLKPKSRTKQYVNRILQLMGNYLINRDIKYQHIRVFLKNVNTLFRFSRNPMIGPETMRHNKSTVKKYVKGISSMVSLRLAKARNLPHLLSCVGRIISRSWRPFVRPPISSGAAWVDKVTPTATVQIYKKMNTIATWPLTFP